MDKPDELFSFGGVATINYDFSESGGDTSGLFDDAHSDGSGVVAPGATQMLVMNAGGAGPNATLLGSPVQVTDLTAVARCTS